MATNVTNPGGTAKFTEDFQEGDGVQRQSTLKKDTSARRTGSVGGGAESRNSVFYTPIPTQSNPTEILANRFNGKLSVLNNAYSHPNKIEC